MKILAPTPENIALAAAALRAGDVVGMPTETVYGLAGVATDAGALAKIFAVKERPTFDPLICHVAAVDLPSREWMDQLGQAGLVDEAQLDVVARGVVEQLAAKFWPGPLTLVLPKQPAVPDLATSGMATVAVRCPRHPVAQQLLRQVGIPLAAPSANRFGRISPTTAAHVVGELGDRVAYVLDGGPCEVGIESTVLRIEAGGVMRLLRPGGVTAEMIAEATGNTVATVSETASGATPLSSPGLLASHYAPQKPLCFLEKPLSRLSKDERAAVVDGLAKQGRVGVIVFDLRARAQWEWEFPQLSTITQLSSSGDLPEAARRLFGTLRALDEHPQVDYLVAETLEGEHGLAYAINDRLRRAGARHS